VGFHYEVDLSFFSANLKRSKIIIYFRPALALVHVSTENADGKKLGVFSTGYSRTVSVVWNGIILNFIISRE